MNQKRKSSASVVALGGVLAALAVVIMSLGGLIPVATYISPMLCAILLQLVLLTCHQPCGWSPALVKGGYSEVDVWITRNLPWTSWECR